MSALTDVPGIRVGHWTDAEGRTGCTVVLLPDDGAVASVDVRGAAPGTRETDLLRPEATVPARPRDRAERRLRLRAGRGRRRDGAPGGTRHRYADPGRPGADRAGGRALRPAVGSATARPDAAAGRAACRRRRAGAPCGTGRVGAGTGATVGKLFGVPATPGWAPRRRRCPAARRSAPLVAVNAVGDVVDEDGAVLAGAAARDRRAAARRRAPPTPPVGRHEHHAGRRRDRRAADQGPGHRLRGPPTTAGPGDPAGAHGVRRGHGVRGQHRATASRVDDAAPAAADGRRRGGRQAIRAPTPSPADRLATRVRRRLPVEGRGVTARRAGAGRRRRRRAGPPRTPR